MRILNIYFRYIIYILHKPSIRFSNEEKHKFDSQYYAISACVEPTGENNIENPFSTQDLVIPSNINEALQSPVWKK